MKERAILRSAILVFWTLFWGLSVVDKIIPDVQFLWVGKDFFALFIKFFGSLGLKDPLFATVALAGVSGLEAINFSLYLIALLSLRNGDEAITDTWFFRAILASVTLFSLFSIADQVFAQMQGYQGPEGGFFLWLPVPDGEAAALRLWSQTGVRTLPGAYLSREVSGFNPGAGFIRVALCGPKDDVARGLTRLRNTLYT